MKRPPGSSPGAAAVPFRSGVAQFQFAEFSAALRRSAPGVRRSPSSLRSGFATNLNVVTERTTLPLAVWRHEALRMLNTMDFVVQPIWWRTVKLPAGKAVRLTYKTRYNVRGKRIVAALTQYALMGNGGAYVFTYTTLPRLAAKYRATFERSARSLRFR